MKVTDVIAGQKVVTAKKVESLGVVADLMRQHGITGVPIVDDWGVLCGLVTARALMELARAWSRPSNLPADGTWGSEADAGHRTDAWQKMAAADFMATDLCTVTHDSDVTDAARAMVNRGVHRAVVLGKDRNVLGVLSALDVVLLVAEGKLHA